MLLLPVTVRGVLDVDANVGRYRAKAMGEVLKLHPRASGQVVRLFVGPVRALLLFVVVHKLVPAG